MTTCSYYYYYDDDYYVRLDLVTESFVLFVDPYHKQVYQLPTEDDLTVVRGVAMPTDAQFPLSVVVSADEGLVYWIDSSARLIVSSHFTDDWHRTIVDLPPGEYLVFSCYSCYSNLFKDRKLCHSRLRVTE